MSRDAHHGRLAIHQLPDGIWQVLWQNHGTWEFDRVLAFSWIKGVTPVILARRGARIVLLVGMEERISFEESIETAEMHLQNDELVVTLLRDGKSFFRLSIPFNPPT